MRRNSRRLLPFVMLDLFPVMAHRMAEEDKGGSGGGDDQKGDDQKKDEKKVELTEADLQKRIDDALAAERDKHQKQVEKDKLAADEKAAKEKGEFKTLYESERDRSAKLEGDLLQANLTLRRTQVVDRMRELVANEHAAYLPAVKKYMAPLLRIDAPDLSDDEADKQVKQIVADYVKDNPRSSAGGTTTTHHNRGKSDSGDGGGGTTQRTAKGRLPLAPRFSAASSM